VLIFTRLLHLTDGAREWKTASPAELSRPRPLSATKMLSIIHYTILQLLCVSCWRNKLASMDSATQVQVALAVKRYCSYNYLPPPSPPITILNHQLRGLLRNPIHRRLDMPRDQHGHHTGIHHPQVLRAIHHQRRTDDPPLVLRQHRARADGMEDGQGSVEHKVAPLRIVVPGVRDGSHTGFVLGRPDGGHGGGVGNLASVLDSFDGGLNIVLVGEVVGVDCRRDGEVGGLDVHAAAAEGVHDGGDEGDEPFAEERRPGCGISFHAGVAVREDDLQLGYGGVGKEGEFLTVRRRREGACGLAGERQEMRIVAAGGGPIHKRVAAAGVIVQRDLAGAPEAELLVSEGGVGPQDVKRCEVVLELV